jgi:hypothetical protein
VTRHVTRPTPVCPAQTTYPGTFTRGQLRNRGISIARQKIQVGIGHAGRTVAVEQADTTFRIYDGDQLLTEVTRSTTKPIARFKARKPEPPRRPPTTLSATEMV